MCISPALLLRTFVNTVVIAITVVNCYCLQWLYALPFSDLIHLLVEPTCVGYRVWCNTGTNSFRCKRLYFHSKNY